MAHTGSKNDENKNDHGFVAIGPPEEISLPTPQLAKDSILFWISRSKNQNLVVYEALQTNGVMDHYNGIAGYWLDIDPEFVNKKRQKGIMTDREELNFMEKKLAYGYTTRLVKSKIYEITIVSVPEISIQLITDSDHKPHAVTNINGHACYLRTIYVATKESWHSKVLSVTLTGIQIDSGKLQSSKKVL